MNFNFIEVDLENHIHLLTAWPTNVDTRKEGYNKYVLFKQILLKNRTGDVSLAENSEVVWNDKLSLDQRKSIGHGQLVDSEKLINILSGEKYMYRESERISDVPRPISFYKAINVEDISKEVQILISALKRAIEPGDANIFENIIKFKDFYGKA